MRSCIVSQCHTDDTGYTYVSILLEGIFALINQRVAAIRRERAHNATRGGSQWSPPSPLPSSLPPCLPPPPRTKI